MSQRLKPRGTLIRFHPTLQIGVQVLIASDIRKSPEKGQTVLQAGRARALWRREPVQHMGLQRVLRGEIGVQEITGQVAHHAQALHNGL